MEAGSNKEQNKHKTSLELNEDLDRVAFFKLKQDFPSPPETNKQKKNPNQTYSKRCKTKLDMKFTKLRSSKNNH